MKRNSDAFGTLVKMKIVLVFCSLILSSVEENKEVSVIKALSFNIGKMVLKCQTELEFKNDVIQDLVDFWNEKNGLKSTDLGCALVCVFEENQFLNEDGSQVQIAQVDAFFKSAGADELMSRRLVELFELCKKTTKQIKNLCDSALEMAKCFRYGILQMHWAPEQDYWNHTQAPTHFEPKQVSDEKQAALRRELNRRNMFTKLFRNKKKNV